MIVRCDATMWGRKRRRADTRESFHSSLQRVESDRKHKEKERGRRTRVSYYYCIESAPRRLQSISPSTQTVDVRFGRPLGRDSLPRNSSAVPGGVLYSSNTTPYYIIIRLLTGGCDAVQSVSHDSRLLPHGRFVVASGPDQHERRKVSSGR